MFIYFFCYSNVCYYKVVGGAAFIMHNSGKIPIIAANSAQFYDLADYQQLLLENMRSFK